MKSTFHFPSCLAVAIVACTLLGMNPVHAATLTVTDPGIYASASGTAAAVATTDQALMGSGSWQANGTAKSSIGFSPADLGFDSGITINDIQSISWSTFKTTSNSPDWYLTIYTVPPAVPDGTNNNGAGWYGLRMTFEGLYSYSYSDPANQWNTYSTGVGTNQLTMHDSNTTNAGFYGGPTLADIQAAGGEIDWSNYANSNSTATFDYASTPIAAFVLETGNPWAGQGYDGFLDQFEVTVGGVTTTVDFEAAVPEPGTLALAGLAGMFGTVVYLRRRWA